MWHSEWEITNITTKDEKLKAKPKTTDSSMLIELRRALTG